jgi:hypothetical protein
MVSWTIPLAYIYHGKNADGNSLTNPSHAANSYPSYLLTVLQKNRLISTLQRTKEETYCHDNDKKYFRNSIICGSFYG